MSTNWRSKHFVYHPDLDAYCARIGYAGEREPTLETLFQIQWHHLLAIPFETLDIHSIGYVDITPEAIERKLVHGGRGGFCYENNILLMHVLRSLGFNVTPAIARTRWNRPADIVSTPTHLVLIVVVDGVSWLVDAGFSSFGSPYPLRIDTDAEQQTPIEPRRITRDGDFYIHQMYAQQKWSDIYSFTVQESFPMDWEMGAHYVCTHPTCPAKLQLIVSMPTVTQTRYLLVNNVLHERKGDGTSESRTLETEKELREVLRSVFHLQFPDETALHVPTVVWKDAQ